MAIQANGKLRKWQIWANLANFKYQNWFSILNRVAGACRLNRVQACLIKASKVLVFSLHNYTAFFQLMKHVRLPLISREFLMTHVDTENLVRENAECKELLLEAMRYHLLPEQRSSLTSIRTTVRRPDGMKPYLFAIGNAFLDIFAYSSHFLIINCNNANRWRKFVCNPQWMWSLQPTHWPLGFTESHDDTPVAGRRYNSQQAALRCWGVYRKL